MLKWLTVLLSVIVLSSCAMVSLLNPKPFGIAHINQLDAKADFSFAVFANNKGASPYNMPDFGRMAGWVQQAGDSFVIGAANHWQQDDSAKQDEFASYIANNAWWQQNFYPAASKANNNVRLDCFTNQDQLVWAPDTCSYYRKIAVKNYTVHLIQVKLTPGLPNLHPTLQPKIAQWFSQVLDDIVKTPFDIVIASAATDTPTWTNEFNPLLQKQVMDTCDLVISGGSGFFERTAPDGYEQAGALCINAGGINQSTLYCPPGYVQVHVLNNPRSLMVQYQNCQHLSRELMHPEYAIVRFQKDATIRRPDFRKPRQNENAYGVMGTLHKNVSAKQMSETLKQLYQNATGASYAIGSAKSGLDAGPVQLRHLYYVTPNNQSVWAVHLTTEQAQKILGKAFTPNAQKVWVAMEQNYAQRLSDYFNLPQEDLRSTQYTQIELLRYWMKQQ